MEITMAEAHGLNHIVLSSEEENELAAIIAKVKQASDLLLRGEITLEEFNSLHIQSFDARQKITLHNRRFVFKIAKQYAPNNNITIDDLISEGNIGLMHAIENWDPEKGKFTTYAAYFIHQSIITFLVYQNAQITVPLYLVEEMSVVRKAIAELKDKLHREPIVAEIATHTEKSEKKINSILSAIRCRYRPMTSLYSAGENADKVLEIEDSHELTPDQVLEQETVKDLVHKQLAKLDNRSQIVVRLYFGIGEERSRTLQEVGTMCGLTRERIRQIVKDATEKLRMEMT